MVCDLLEVHKIELACCYDLKIGLDGPQEIECIRSDLVELVLAQADLPLLADGAAALSLEQRGVVVLNHSVDCLKHVLMGIVRLICKTSGELYRFKL